MDSSGLRRKECDGEIIDDSALAYRVIAERMGGVVSHVRIGYIHINTSLDSVKAQLADANEKLNPQEDSNDTGSNTDASGTGETAAPGSVCSYPASSLLDGNGPDVTSI